MEKSMLLEAYLKRLRLPAIGRHYQELARQAAQGNLPYEAFLLALVEMEAQQREENAHQKRLRMARFPVIKSLDQFDFTTLPSLNKALVLDLAQGGYLDKRENLILMGNSGTGKTHLATALGLIACQQGRKVRFFTAAGLINQLTEAGSSKKSHFPALLAGNEPQRRGQMGLAGAAVPHQDQVLSLIPVSYTHLRAH